jgi:FAD/FMN-containing dehydrogenase
MIDAIVDAAEKPLSEYTTIIIQPLGGQVHRVAESNSAMGWRKAKWALHILGMWEDPAQDAEQTAWVRNLAEAAAKWEQKGTYLNYLMDEGDQRVKDSFGPNYPRMVELKNNYDPTNLFCFNQNIKPSA